MARDLMGLLRAPNCAFDHADGTVYEYEGNCYFESVYVRGSLLFDSIRDDMGNDAFWGALREYVDAHRNGFGTTRGLFDALDAATDVNLRPRIEALLPSLY
jgi:aminopeptidase N